MFISFDLLSIKIVGLCVVSIHQRWCNPQFTQIMVTYVSLSSCGPIFRCNRQAPVVVKRKSLSTG